MGYVYLIGTPTFGWYKIGKSKTPEVRVKDLGILLPFKVRVFGVWKAKNHHLLEQTLHEIYAANRINGEWFEFAKKEVYIITESIPDAARVYPINNTLTEELNNFSNIDEDTKGTRRVLGVRIENLRGDFTPEERALKRQEGIMKQAQKRANKIAEGIGSPQ